VKSIAILSLDNIDIQNDSRVLRQVKYLGKEFPVDVITFGDEQKEINLPVRSVHFVGSLRHTRRIQKLKTLLLLPLGRLFPKFVHEKWYWQRKGHRETLRILKQLDVAFIHANDWWSLPVAVEAARTNGAKVVLDLHEFAYDEYESQFFRKYLYSRAVAYFLDKYKSAAVKTVTINSIISEKYRQVAGLDPLVVMNAPEISTLPAYRRTDPGFIRLIHHGFAMPERRLEVMIDVAALLEPRYHLTMMLLGNENYLHKLQHYAEAKAPGRVEFIPAVAPRDIISTLGHYDMGIFVLPNTSFNFNATLPNKFFEFAGAGLAVCIGPSPAMATLINQYQFGVVGATFEPKDIAQLLNNTTPIAIDRMKTFAVEASKYLNADFELGKLVDLYRSLYAADNYA
jgi:glycogen synthase